MDDFWFQEELVPTEATIERVAQEEVVKSATVGVGEAYRELRNTVRGILRVDKPRWGELDAASHRLLLSGKDMRFYLVRLGFQFDLPPEARDKGTRFTHARCSAYLWPANIDEPQPRVYAVIPSDLYEGQPRRVSIKFGPEIKLGEVSGSLGEVGTDFMIGTVEPAIVGYPGADEREPYWDIRPKSKALLGVRHFWLVIEVPSQCSGVRLAAQVEGEVQTHFGPIPIGPQSREWATRPSIVIR